MKQCPFCAEEIADAAIKCKHCGSMLAEAPPEYAALDKNTVRIKPGQKPLEPIIAALLSGCCIAGLGQMLLGQVVKGVALLVGAVIFAVITAGVGALIAWPIMGVDAYMVASRLKEGKPVGQWDFFPSA